MSKLMVPCHSVMPLCQSQVGVQLCSSILQGRTCSCFSGEDSMQHTAAADL